MSHQYAEREIEFLWHLRTKSVNKILKNRYFSDVPFELVTVIFRCCFLSSGSTRALKPQNNVERINRELCLLHFNGDPCTTIISCYSHTSTSNETDITTCFNDMSSLAQHIPKHNVLIIGRDVISKDRND